MGRGGWGRICGCVLLLLVAVACSNGDGGGGDGDGDGAGPATVFPGDQWGRADPEELGFDRAALDRIADEVRSGGASCLVVVRHGLIAGEWYWNGTDAATTYDTLSVTKSYAGTLVGMAQGDGRLDIGDDAATYIERWTGTASSQVTIRNLLSNDSGRRIELGEGLFFDPAFVAATDTTAYAIGLDQAHPPGTVWAYNGPAIQTLEAILEEATGRSPATYAEDELFEPIGAHDTHMSEDRAGNTQMDTGVRTSCQDAARFGYLFLREGDWNGTQVVAEDWVRAATGQPSQDLLPAYGYLWWLNQPASSALGSERVELPPGHDTIYGSQRQIVPTAPASVYWAVGASGQIIQIDPGTDTVVVRLGAANPLGQSGFSYVPLTTRVITEALPGEAP